MAEYITGFHAIEEALKDEGLRGTLFICRNMEKRNDRLESLARYQGKVKVKKVARVEMDRMSPGTDHRGALLSITVRDKSTSKAFTVSEFISSLSDGQAATVLILDGITDDTKPRGYHAQCRPVRCLPGHCSLPQVGAEQFHSRTHQQRCFRHVPTLYCDKSRHGRSSTCRRPFLDIRCGYARREADRDEIPTPHCNHHGSEGSGLSDSDTQEMRCYRFDTYSWPH